MKKRVISVLLTISLVLSTGCSAANSNTQGATTAASESSSTEQAADDSKDADSSKDNSKDADSSKDNSDNDEEQNDSVEAKSTEESDDNKDMGEPSESEDISDEDGSSKGTVTTGGSPWIDSDLKENISADMETSPKDDFHLYVNKEWTLENNIPDGYFSWSLFEQRSLDVTNQCRELLEDESLTGHDAELIQTYYKLVLDWDTRNKLGVSELQDVYDQIIAVKNLDDITKLMTTKELIGKIYCFVSAGPSTGLNDPDKYLVALSEPSVMLADPAEYSSRTEYGDMYYGYRKNMFIFMAEKMGMSADDAEKIFDTAIELETKFSQKMYTTADKKKDDYFDKINNEMLFDDVCNLVKAFPLGDILTCRGFNYDGIYLVTKPDYYEVLDEIYTEENVDAIKDIMLVRYLLSYARSVDRETYDKAIELSNTYFGISGSVSDEEMAYSEVSGSLTTSMQKVYVSKYGSEDDKEKLENLCKDIINSYRELLTENEWASDEVKAYAIEKLDKITLHVAYPDKFRDTSNIDISGCTLIEADDKIAEDERKYHLSLIGNEVDNDVWADGNDILSCNAAYDSSTNTINMYIGMLGEPFYSSDMTTEELYASIGAFWVGHEISHAFDNTGSQFDAEGQYRDWWTPEDKKEFQKRVSKVDKYLDSIVAFGDYHFIGTNIDTEMIADMTGVQNALRMAKKIDGFDYDKFFTKYAQMNVSLNIYSGELSILLQDEHPLAYSRTNVPVQQFEEFYETYDIKEGDNMYLAPEDRLIIW